MTPPSRLFHAALWTITSTSTACGGKSDPAEPTPSADAQVDSATPSAPRRDVGTEASAPRTPASDFHDHFQRSRSVLLAQVASVPSPSKAKAVPEASETVDAPARACAPLSPGTIYQFIELNNGKTPCPTPMSQSEIEAKLGDPFSTSVLRKGTFPFSVDELVDAIDAANPDFVTESYMVGEGSQVPLDVADRDQPRNLRYVVTWGPRDDPQNAQIFLSASPGGDSGFLQVISWDDTRKRFNFFEALDLRQSDAVWAWAGDSSLARAEDTKGAGCFDCHHDGVVIMKELTLPWNNWQSPRATISPNVVPAAVAAESLFQGLNGADSYESVVTGSAQKYHREWLEEHFVRGQGSIELTSVDLMLAHLTEGTTINFVSSASQSGGSGDIEDVPSNALLWDELFSTALGLNYRIPKLSIPRGSYSSFLDQHGYQLVQRLPSGTQTCASAPDVYAMKPASTHFALFTPAPSFDDRFMVTQLISAGIVDKKFVTSVALVDLANPVFSTLRSGLQEHAPTTGTITGGVSSVPGDFVDAVRRVAAGQPACDPSALDRCSAEQQFLAIYDADDWTSAAEKRIQAYLDTFASLSDEDRTDKLMKLVVDRQQAFTTWPIISNLNEFCLLLPRSDLRQ